MKSLAEALWYTQMVFLSKKSTADSRCQTEKCSDDRSSQSLYTSRTKRLLCTGSAFLGKYASITVVNLIQRKKLYFQNFRDSNLMEARFEILYCFIRIMRVSLCSTYEHPPQRKFCTTAFQTLQCSRNMQVNNV